jgi:ABC-type multidrug transport system ATPase subunit
MLTGVVRPSSGDATVYGYSILDNLEYVQQRLGLCQQFDVLFDKLTVKEHL